jgi:hypothetical protein
VYRTVILREGNDVGPTVAPVYCLEKCLSLHAERERGEFPAVKLGIARPEQLQFQGHTLGDLREAALQTCRQPLQQEAHLQVLSALQRNTHRLWG